MTLADYLFLPLLFAQGEAAPAADPAAGDANPLSWLLGNPLLPMVMIGVLFYFLLIMPERKKRKELEAKLSELKKNDPVITTGGICGTVITAAPGSKFVTVRVDDSTKLKLLRSHITHIGSHDEAEFKDKKEGSAPAVTEK